MGYVKKLWAGLVATIGLRMAEELAALVMTVSVLLMLLLWLGIPTQAPPVVTKTTPDTTTVQVDATKLTPKVVDKLVYIQDKAEVNKLLAENAKLKSTVVQLNQTMAMLQSTGSGKIETVPTETVPTGLLPWHMTQPTVQQFKDWRLTFIQNGTDATYSLTQNFEVLSTTGRLKDGKPFTDVKVFEVGPADKRTPLHNVQTVSVYADQTKPHWNLHPTVQAGVAWAQGAEGAVVGLQFIRHGRTKAAEDTTYSVLTPVLFVTSKVKEAGLLPFSVNLGQIKHQPLRDVWVSPFIGIDVQKQKVARYGFAFTASF
jgi:hypothetical protein